MAVTGTAVVVRASIGVVIIVTAVSVVEGDVSGASQMERRDSRVGVVVSVRVVSVVTVAVVIALDIRVSYGRVRHGWDDRYLAVCTTAGYRVALARGAGRGVGGLGHGEEGHVTVWLRLKLSCGWRRATL